MFSHIPWFYVWKSRLPKACASFKWMPSVKQYNPWAMLGFYLATISGEVLQNKGREAVSERIFSCLICGRSQHKSEWSKALRDGIGLKHCLAVTQTGSPGPWTSCNDFSISLAIRSPHFPQVTSQLPYFEKSKEVKQASALEEPKYCVRQGKIFQAEHPYPNSETPNPNLLRYSHSTSNGKTHWWLDM